MNCQRANYRHIYDDKAYAELIYLQQVYKGVQDNFHWKHKLSRRVSVCSIFLIVLSLGYLLAENYFNMHITFPAWVPLKDLFKTFLPLILLISISVFSSAFFANRLFGYTRAWSRNRLMWEHLERLKREYQLAIYGKDPTQAADKKFIEIEQENILAKLFQLEETNRIQTHQDIVGDHISAHTGVFSWLKNLKK